MAPSEPETTTDRPVARVYTPSQKARSLKKVAKIGVTAASRELGISRFSHEHWDAFIRWTLDRLRTTARELGDPTSETVGLKTSICLTEADLHTFDKRTVGVRRTQS